MSKHLVMVYGTLMSGQHNNWRLMGQRYIGQSETKEAYYRTTFISVYKAPNPTYPEIRKETVTGELWEVDDSCLASMDSLEHNGMNGAWRREQIEVMVGETSYKAWLYFRLTFQWSLEK